MTSVNSFRHFVEQELGKFPYLIIYAILEWTLIALLFLDGFLAFFSSKFANFFDLHAPCVLCTRIDHIFTRKKSHNCYYNDSICEGHKKDLSSLAYCHVHKKLSDIRRMCEGCLLSFATDNKSDCVAYKSLNGALNKDIEGLFDEEMRARLKLQPFERDDLTQGGDKSGNRILCSCCGEYMKMVKPSTSVATSSRVSQGPTSSPRAAFALWKAEKARCALDTSSPRNEDTRNLVIPASKEDLRAATAPFLTEPDFLIDDVVRTPPFMRGNRFFGMNFTDSPGTSPRWANRMPRKSFLELGSDPVEAIIAGNDTNTETILDRLKSQVRLDRKSLLALYMELDEERSASTVAANNAMAMITRLQAEKAAVQMEGLQYTRMMDEQAKYDQEALQMIQDLLAKREDEIKDLEGELDFYRDRCGLNREMIRRGDPFEKSLSFSSFTDHESPLFRNVAKHTEMDLQEHDSDKSMSSSHEDGDNRGGKIDNHDDDYYYYEDDDDGVREISSLGSR